MKNNAHIYVPPGLRPDLDALAEVYRLRRESLSAHTVAYWRRLVEENRAAIDAVKRAREQIS